MDDVGTDGFEPRPQGLVLTLLGAYRPSRRRSIWSGGLVTLLGEFGFSTGAARAASARMVRRGLLDRLRKGRLVFYRPTRRALALLEEGDRRIFSLGREPHGAESWTVLWHAIPEERRIERGRLARRLRFLGFGSVGDGMWISPHDRERDVVGLIAELRVTGHAGVMLGRPAASLDVRALVSRAWDLDALDGRYRAFTREFSPYGEAGGRRGMGDREVFLLRTRLVHAFRRFPALDPELPDKLVPAPRHRAEAVALFHRLYDVLAPPAQRHFEAVTTPP